MFPCSTVYAQRVSRSTHPRASPDAQPTPPLQHGKSFPATCHADDPRNLTNSFLPASHTVNPRAVGLTKLVSQLTREGQWSKGLEVFDALDAVGLLPDTTITNAAISACDKGGQWEKALQVGPACAVPPVVLVGWRVGLVSCV